MTLGDVFIEQDACIAPHSHQRVLAVEKRVIPRILTIMLDQVEA